jgi:hypothetical protein
MLLQFVCNHTHFFLISQALELEPSLKSLYLSMPYASWSPTFTQVLEKQGAPSLKKLVSLLSSIKPNKILQREDGVYDMYKVRP